ncbi:MAG TPA: M20 family metallo-hydrolase [Candidatus Acidoferrales bacterium]|nr:M20 family metallo-hydrolase [Candidatus Acidoferrales bacterium]
MSPTVSAERLLDDLDQLARIGGRPDGGVDRVAGSEADLEARRWLRGRLEAAGLEARADEINNVFGRLPGSRPPWLLIGSHTDTVPAGGRLDGAYGVIAALEVVRALKDAGDPAAGRLEVVSFHDEERGLFGSRALCAGPHVRELAGYLELHIEQGPRLESEGCGLGVVEGIVGIQNWEVVVRGAANHAGTTPWALRRDAGAVAGSLMAGLAELVQAVDPEMVANIGVLQLSPGARNVVPGEARLTVQVRCLREASLERGAAAIRGALEEAAQARGCRFEMTLGSANPPVAMDERVVAALERVCERSGRRWRRLVSGAGHDAQMLAAQVPAGMLFVPSRGGVSHSPLEHTADDLLVAGAQALLEGALEVLPLLPG